MYIRIVSKRTKQKEINTQMMGFHMGLFKVTNAYSFYLFLFILNIYHEIVYVIGNMITAMIYELGYFFLTKFTSRIV